MREIWFAALLAAGVVLSVTPASAQSGAASPSAPTDKASILKLHPGDRILGRADAPITIIEYASMTCPHCAHFQTEILPTIKKQWIDTGKAKLVLRDFPLDGLALRAAMIARCALPDRFYAFADTFFADQAEWAISSDAKGALERLARLGGMGPKKFDACFSDNTLENKILASRLTATKYLGVDSTPTFFVNGKKFVGAPTVDAFDKLLSSVAPKA